MNIKDSKKKLEQITKLKKVNNYNDFTLQELKELPRLTGIVELNFNNNFFYMINIENDDAIPLKYLWRDRYENTSLNLWYKMTRKDGFCIDIGAHTGIYSIIGNLNRNENNIISIEAFFINYARLLSNLKLNKINPDKCFLGAVSNSEGLGKFRAKTFLNHSTGGGLSEDGTISVNKIKIDNFKLEKKICGIKIDTEGNELEVLQGAQNYINKDKPDILFEINENCFDKCLEFLSYYGYVFYFVDEVDKKITKIVKFNDSLKKPEGSNCYATFDNAK
jgi:FkbM family methyltransferase